jgi:hypothetical protein
LKVNYAFEKHGVPAVQDYSKPGELKRYAMLSRTISAAILVFPL